MIILLLLSTQSSMFEKIDLVAANQRKWTSTAVPIGFDP